MTYTVPVKAGSSRYLELLANTALSTDERLDQDEALLWELLDSSWRQLTKHKHDPSALANISMTALALLRVRTGTPVPALAAEQAALHVNKNAGYAGIGNADPWANFRESEAFGIPAYEGVLVRLSDKCIRLRNLRANPANDRVGESLNATLEDTVAYPLIGICLWEEARLDGGSV